MFRVKKCLLKAMDLVKTFVASLSQLKSRVSRSIVSFKIHFNHYNQPCTNLNHHFDHFEIVLRCSIFGLYFFRLCTRKVCPWGFVSNALACNLHATFSFQLDFTIYLPRFFLWQLRSHFLNTKFDLNWKHLKENIKSK